MRRATSGTLLLCLGMGLTATAARADVIYQAFNERFSDLESKLDNLAAIGYSHVQVSPPEKSANNDIWWARYQPLDLTVLDSPLGNEADLQHLIAAAHQRHLKVIVDVVMNHMADVSYNGGTLNFPQFGPADFHFADTRPCIDNYNDRYQVTHYWLCDLTLGHHLPDLDSSSPHVRTVHKAYLTKLLGLGADGFRFDAAKHIDPDYFQEILSIIPQGSLVYGEVIAQNLAEAQDYSSMMKVTDFTLLSTMLNSFNLNGDLRNLVDPEAYQAALPGPQAVVFARNHDTAMHSNFFNFGDYQDALLATAFVVGRGVGTPFVYRDDYAQPLVTAAVRFHNTLSSQPTYVRTADQICGGCDPRTLLFVERGSSGVMIINSANAWVDTAAAQMPGLSPGCYRELSNNFTVQVAYGTDGNKWISRWGTSARGGLNIGPRTALFLSQVGAGECSK